MTDTDTPVPVKRDTVGMTAAENTPRRSHVPMRHHKALSVRQPWASMIAGLCPGVVKTIETRTWRTDYRGDLVICSSGKPDTPGMHWPRGEYPAGYALCIAELVACRPMTWHDCEKACCDLYDRAWAWVLRDIRRIEPPVKVKGRLGIFGIELKVPKVNKVS